MIESLLTSKPAWVQLGLVLAHFLWQGAAIALLLAAALWLLRHRSPNARYILCGAAMLLMAACPALTLSYVRTHPLPILAITQSTVLPPINLPPLQDIPDSEVLSAAGDEEMTENVDVLPNRAHEQTVTPPLDHPRTERHHSTASDSSTLRQLWLARGLECSALVWSIGVLVLSLRLMIGWWRLRRLSRRDTESLPEAVEAMVRRLSERLRVTHRVRVLAAKAWNGPAAFGLLKPVVLMPVAVLTQCPHELIEAMIAHELAHIRRYDLWVNLLQRVIETLLFYHPAIWWVSGRMRMERELCCDDLAVQATGRRADYASALVEICRLQPSWVTPAMAAGILSPKLSLLTRVRRVLQSSSIPGESNRSRFWLSGPLSIVLAGAFVFIACTRIADTRSVAATQPTMNTQRETKVVSERSKAIDAEQQVQTGPASNTPAPPSSLLIHFDNTPLRKAVEEFGQMSGLRINGINSIHPDVAQTPITLVIPQPIAFDEALTSFNQVILDAERGQGLVDSGIWIVRREQGLVIRTLTEWYHHIPAQNWFASDADYRQAKLPGWEIARVQYKPRALGTAYLVALAMDTIPYNTSRAITHNVVPAPNDASFDLAGFVYFIDSQLEVLARRDVPEHPQILNPVEVLDLMARGNVTPANRGPASQPAAGGSRADRSASVSGRAIGVPMRSEPTYGPRVQVRTLADGIITKIEVKEGQTIKKGDLLIGLDNKDIQLDLDAAKARARETAAVLDNTSRSGESAQQVEYAKAESAAKLAEVELRRCQLRLERTQFISPADGLVCYGNNLAGMVGKRVTAGEILLSIQTTTSQEAAAAPANTRPRVRYFVKFVLGKGRMTFEGEDVTWDELPKRLERVPDREHTVFEFANTSEDLTLSEFNEARFRAMKLQKQFGFEYFSEVGEHPLGTKGSPDQVLPETLSATQPAG